MSIILKRRKINTPEEANKILRKAPYWIWLFTDQIVGPFEDYWKAETAVIAKLGASWYETAQIIDDYGNPGSHGAVLEDEALVYISDDPDKVVIDPVSW